MPQTKSVFVELYTSAMLIDYLLHVAGYEAYKLTPHTISDWLCHLTYMEHSSMYGGTSPHTIHLHSHRLWHLAVYEKATLHQLSFQLHLARDTAVSQGYYTTTSIWYNSIIWPSHQTTNHQNLFHYIIIQVLYSEIALDTYRLHLRSLLASIHTATRKAPLVLAS